MSTVYKHYGDPEKSPCEKHIIARLDFPTAESAIKAVQQIIRDCVGNHIVHPEFITVTEDGENALVWSWHETHLRHVYTGMFGPVFGTKAI